VSPPGAKGFAVTVSPNFSERGQTLVIRPRDIEWIESQGAYQAIRASGVAHLVRRTLEDLEDLEGRLAPDHFVRIHRSTRL